MRARCIALVSDEYPVVRAYAAERLLAKHPEEAEHVLPLITDHTELVIRRYDGMELSTVGGFVLRNLRRAARRSPAAAIVYGRATAER
jgi:hypothetical protein